VKVRAVVTGGAPQSGGLVVTGADTVALSLESVTGITSVLWEIYSFPATATCPTGWTDDSAHGRFYYSGLTPPTIDLAQAAAGGSWGKWLIRATGNAGVRGGAASVAPADGTTMVDESTAFAIRSPEGLRGLAHLESTQFDAVRGWAGELDADWQVLDEKVVAATGPKGDTGDSGLGTLLASQTFSLAAYTDPGDLSQIFAFAAGLAADKMAQVTVIIALREETADYAYPIVSRCEFTISRNPAAFDYGTAKYCVVLPDGTGHASAGIASKTLADAVAGSLDLQIEYDGDLTLKLEQRAHAMKGVCEVYLGTAYPLAWT
jgi:hypothetical protein